MKQYFPFLVLCICSWLPLAYPAAAAQGPNDSYVLGSDLLKQFADESNELEDATDISAHTKAQYEKEENTILLLMKNLAAHADTQEKQKHLGTATIGLQQLLDSPLRAQTVEMCTELVTILTTMYGSGARGALYSELNAYEKVLLKENEKLAHNALAPEAFYQLFGGLRSLFKVKAAPDKILSFKNIMKAAAVITVLLLIYRGAKDAQHFYEWIKVEENRQQLINATQLYFYDRGRRFSRGVVNRGARGMGQASAFIHTLDPRNILPAGAVPGAVTGAMSAVSHQAATAAEYVPFGSTVLSAAQAAGPTAVLHSNVASMVFRAKTEGPKMILGGIKGATKHGTQELFEDKREALVTVDPDYLEGRAEEGADNEQ